MRARDPDRRGPAFVAAGGSPTTRPTSPATVREDLRRSPTRGSRRPVRAGADAIGLNLVPGTPRALSVDEAAELPDARGPRCPADRRSAAGR